MQYTVQVQPALALYCIVLVLYTHRRLIAKLVVGGWSRFQVGISIADLSYGICHNCHHQSSCAIEQVGYSKRRYSTRGIIVFPLPVLAQRTDRFSRRITWAIFLGTRIRSYYSNHTPRHLPPTPQNASCRLELFFHLARRPCPCRVAHVPCSSPSRPHCAAWNGNDRVAPHATPSLLRSRNFERCRRRGS